MRGKRARVWAMKANRMLVRAIVTLLWVYAIVSLLVTRNTSEVFGGAPALLLLFTLPLFGLAPATLLHELGHAIAARLVGWRVWIICVGPVLVRFAPRVTIETRASLGGDAGGFVLPSPRTPEQATTLRKIIVTAGGPIASIAGAALAFWWAAPYVENPGWVGIVAITAHVFAISSLACAVLTLWPQRDDFGVGNDVVQIIDTLRHRPAPRRTFFRYALSAIDFGFLPSDWDASVSREINAELASDEPCETARAAAFLQALMTGDIETARAAANNPASTEQLGASQYLLAWRHADDGDFTGADEALARTMGPGFFSDWLMRVREIALIGVIAANGDRAGAKERYNRLRYALWKATPINRALGLLLDRAMRGPIGAALEPA